MIWRVFRHSAMNWLHTAVKVDLSAPVPPLQESLRTVDAIAQQETQQFAQRQEASLGQSGSAPHMSGRVLS